MGRLFRYKVRGQIVAVSVIYWSEEQVKRAIDYVELSQGDTFPSVDDID